CEHDQAQQYSDSNHQITVAKIHSPSHHLRFRQFFTRELGSRTQPKSIRFLTLLASAQSWRVAHSKLRRLARPFDDCTSFRRSGQARTDPAAEMVSLSNPSRAKSSGAGFG